MSRPRPASPLSLPRTAPASAPRSQTRSRARFALASLVCAGLWTAALGCQATSESERDSAPAPATAEPRVEAPATDTARSDAPEDRRERAAEAARAAIDAGDFEAARLTLGQVLVEENIERSSAALAANQPSDALRAADRALAVEPRNRRALLLRAEGLVAFGLDLLAQGASGLYIGGAFDDARAAYAEAGRSARALWGASYAAYLTNDGEAALRHARAARIAAREEETPSAPFLSAERHFAQAAFLATLQSIQLSHPAARVAAELEEAEAAFAALAEVEAEDPWTWTAQADLYAWLERPEDALPALRAGLDSLPDHPELVAKLAEVAARAGGPAEAVRVLEDYLADAPQPAAEVRWHLARANWNLALESIPSLGSPPEAFDSAYARFDAVEQAFREVRGRLPQDDARRAEINGWRIVARGARGWVRYWQGRYPEAVEVFLSMDAVQARGIEWEVPGTFRTGLVGLQLVAERWNSEGSYEGAERAAELLWLAHGKQPADAILGNNAGLALRDVADNQDRIARGLCALSRGEEAEGRAWLRMGAPRDLETEGSPAELAARAQEWVERARDSMERSYRAYRAALEVEPFDPYLLRDTALVLVYSLHRDLDLAVEWLESAAEIGQETLARMAEDDEERDGLTEVVGDSHENLGAYYLHHANDVERAVEHFRRAVEIGPAPRVQRHWVRDLIAAHEAGEPLQVPPVRNPLLWARDCE